jgi:hypothetical protein
MEFELIDNKAHRAVWNHFYSRTGPVQGKEIPDVVAALNRNLQQALIQVESGLDSYFAFHPPSKC